MALPVWVDWTNTGVGVAGLALTFGALWQAAGARVAAQRAEKSVLRHNAEVDFASLVHMAKELHGYVENGKIAEARLRTTDMRAELALSIQLHKAFLGKRRDLLDEKLIAMRLVTDKLNQNQESSDLSNSERVRLLEITGEILDVLARQYGELRTSTEQEVPNG